MAKNKVLSAIVEIAGSVSPTLQKAVKGTCDKLDKVNLKAVAVAAAAAAGAVAIGKAAVDAGKHLAGLGDEYNKAINDIAATTGAAGDVLTELGDVVKDVYGNNFGESMGDVASGVSEIYRQTGLTEEALAETTKAAYALSDTFGYDIPESARAAKAMMTNFGISGEEAMSLIAAGAQNGLDFSGELIDSINEYSVQFAKLGFTADDMFNIFQQGADSGAWNLDKVGDAIKEFSIRSIDASDTTRHAFSCLGFDANKMMATFGEGGEGASAAFQEVISALMDMDDEVWRDQIGVELFGTQWEDLGVGAMKALANMEGSAYDTGDAMAGIMDVKYNNMTDAIEAIRRQLEVSLLPLANAFFRAITKIIPAVQSGIERVIPVIDKIVQKAAPLVDDIAAGLAVALENLWPKIEAAAGWLITLGQDGLAFVKNNMDWLIPVVGGLTAAFVAYKAITSAVAIYEGIKTAALATGTTVTGLASAATWVLNGALAVLTSPITLVVAAIGALVAAGIALYRNWDTVKEYAAKLGEFLAGIWDSITTAVGGFLTGIKDGFINAFSSLVGIIKSPINAVIGIINGAINGINKIGFDIPDWVPVIGGKKFALNIPLIPQLAEGGFTDGISIAGEAGMEAVISFDPAHREENVGYWMKAGRLLGVLDEVESGAKETPQIAQAGKLMELDDFSLGQLTESTIIYYDFSGMSYAPKVAAASASDKEDIMAALKEQASEFFDWLEEWLRQKEVGDYDRVSIY